jgi:hypothetical protein
MSKRGREEEELEDGKEPYFFWTSEQDRWFEMLLSAIGSFDPPISLGDKFTVLIKVMGDVCMIPNIAPITKITTTTKSTAIMKSIGKADHLDFKVTLCITHWKQLRLGFAKFCSEICKRLGKELNRDQRGGVAKLFAPHDVHPSIASFFVTFYSVRK